MQFGDYHNQFLFEWQRLDDEAKRFLTWVLESERFTKVGHNLSFDLIVCRFHGIYVQQVFDTMLAEKIITTGIDSDFPSLEEVAWKYCYIRMDKTYQTSFDGSDLDDGQIRYAAMDIKHLIPISRFQIMLLNEKELVNVAALEFDAVIGYAEQTYTGLELRVDYWRELTKEIIPLMEESVRKLDEWATIEEPRALKIMIDKGFYSTEDRAELPLNSPKKLLEMMQWIWSDITGSSKAVASKYIRDNPKAPAMVVLQAFAAGDKEPLGDWLVTNYRDKLIEQGFLIPAGKCTINWNSRDQALAVLRSVNPRLNNLNEETIEKQSHPVFDLFEEYKEWMKAISSYGENFILKNLDTEGKIRTTFNQIMTTGRISSAKPNMQNIPANDAVGNKYRNAFKPRNGCKYVDSDYKSQELAIIAFISQDPVWLGCLRRDEDLHSVCAELVFGYAWRRGAEVGCLYYKSKQKCSCKQHKIMRSAIKSINFGLAYGMSAFKLARQLKITVPEANDMIELYFSKFPKIRGVLTFMGEFGVKNGYIMTRAPFKRKRWFPFWGLNYRYIEEHLRGFRYNETLGSIERASKNMPIQGSAADMMKLAMCMIRWFRDEQGLRVGDQILLAVQVHDQQTTQVVDELAEWWAPHQTRLMEEAANVIVTNGLLKAETNITDLWSK